MFTLPKLRYGYEALEPVIDALTMEIHLTKHHQAYIDNLNKALEKYPELLNKPVEELVKGLKDIPTDIQTAVRNHGGGHLNHSMFWESMAPLVGNEDRQPEGAILTALNNDFGSFDVFKEQFNAAAMGRFGSGWAWLVSDQGKLKVMSTANQDNPISEGMKPILGIDVWEHAYYLKYQNRRKDYVEAWWRVIDWVAVGQRLEL